MKVFVAGATGRVAEYMIEALVKYGHEVTAGARQPERVKSVDGVTAVHLDLHDAVSDLASVLKGQDAVIFTAGSRGKDLFQTDAFGAVKLMEASKEAGIKRFVMLSALYSLEPEKFDQFESLKDYYVAKFFADHYLMDSIDLDYTIIQPGMLVESEGTGSISLESSGVSQIAIPDVGQVLARVVDRPNTVKQVIEIHPGQTAIDALFD